MKVSISVVVFKRLDLTRECLESIRQHTEDYELIVTDNASDDGTASYLQAVAMTNANIRLVKNQENKGFIQPHNHALALSSRKSDLFIVLNNDLKVGSGWLDEIRHSFRTDEKLAICGVHDSCCALSENGTGMPGDTSNPEYVEASCLAIRRDLAVKHGLFSADLAFAYCEDADLSLRMRQLGYRIKLINTPVFHKRASTTKLVEGSVDIEGYVIRNKEILRQRWRLYLETKSFKRKILLKRTGAKGDVLLLTGILRALKQRYPYSELVVVTECPDVLWGNPDVNEIRANTGEISGYDKIFDLDEAYERNPNVPIVQAYADVCGLDLKPSEMTPRIFLNDGGRKQVDWLLRKDRVAVVHPGMAGGVWVGRQWAIDRFDQVSKALQRQGWFVVLVGNQATPKIACDEDIREKSPFSVLAPLMCGAELFVGIDSFPMHVAQAANIPLVAVFGSIDPAFRLMPSPWRKGISANVGCLGCHHYLPAPRSYTDKCIRGRQVCMEGIDVDMVLRAIREAVEEWKRTHQNSMAPAT